MFLICVVKIAIVSIIFVQVSSKFCDERIQSICDCSYMHHEMFWNTHNIQCPKNINVSAYEYTIKVIDMLSVTIECHNYSDLNKLPVLNLNTVVYKVEFKNCFMNGNNRTNYQFELNGFLVRQLNLKIYKTINVVFHEPAKVEERIFFSNLTNIWNLKVENIQLETCALLQNCTNLRVVNFTNTNLVDFGQLNQGGCDGIRIFIVRNTKSIKNLSRTNLAKLDTLQEFKIYNSNIENYFEQSYKEGALFEGSMLKYLVLESTFNNLDDKILLNETLFKGIELYSLTLTDLKLDELPARILWGQRLLRILNLNKNQFVTLDANLLANCSSLTTIDLSNNNFVRFSDTSIFSNIASLTNLRLSYNLLETFKFDVKLYSNFNKIYLDHNSIKTEGDTCPITGISNREGIIDLSFNQITKSRPIIDCLSSNKELKSLDVSNNQMVDLSFEDALPYGRPAIFNTRLNFANNKITYLDFLSSNEIRAVNDKNEVNVYLDSNPLFCHNCMNIKKIFDSKLLSYAINRTSFKIHHPKECLASTSCLLSDIDKTFKCPTPCDCLYNEYTKTLKIDCENNNLTDFPYLNSTDLFKLKFDQLMLNLQFNRLTRIYFGNVSSDLIQKVHTINLENNLIKIVSFHPLEFPSNISILQLASNQIVQFDEPAIELLNSRKHFLSVTLANNPIAADRDLWKQIQNLRKFKISDFMEIQENLKIENPLENIVKPSKSNGNYSSLGVLFGGILVLFLIVIAGIYMMYTYRRYGGRNIFQRLRQQRAASEMMLGGFPDD